MSNDSLMKVVLHTHCNELHDIHIGLTVTWCSRHALQARSGDRRARPSRVRLLSTPINHLAQAHHPNAWPIILWIATLRSSATRSNKERRSSTLKISIDVKDLHRSFRSSLLSSASNRVLLRHSRRIFHCLDDTVCHP